MNMNIFSVYFTVDTENDFKNERKDYVFNVI